MFIAAKSSIRPKHSFISHSITEGWRHQLNHMFKETSRNKRTAAQYSILYITYIFWFVIHFKQSRCLKSKINLFIITRDGKHIIYITYILSRQYCLYKVVILISTFLNLFNWFHSTHETLFYCWSICVKGSRNTAIHLWQTSNSLICLHKSVVKRLESFKEGFDLVHRRKDGHSETKHIN